jgi:hypothetical protein
MLKLEDISKIDTWNTLDAKLLPRFDKNFPLLIAISGGGNAGKSTLFNSLLGEKLSPIHGKAGFTRRVLVAGHPALFKRKDFLINLFRPFGVIPQHMEQVSELTERGVPLYLTNTNVPKSLVLMDTPDFDTGKPGGYENRPEAQKVLEACDVLVYLVTNTTYNNKDNTDFVRDILTQLGQRKCILVYRCSKNFSMQEVSDHLQTTARNLYGDQVGSHVLGYFRTDESDEIQVGKKFMELRPLRPQDEQMMELLQTLDPREIREAVNNSILDDFLRYVTKVVSDSKITSAKIRLYTEALKISQSHAVKDALHSVPKDEIAHRVNTIWIRTSSVAVKTLRTTGKIIGAPFKAVVSLINGFRSVFLSYEKNKGSAIDPLEELKNNLLGAADTLHSNLMAESLNTETTMTDKDGAKLVRLIDSIRKQEGLEENQQPFYTKGIRSGSVLLQVDFPVVLRGARNRFRDQPWGTVAGEIEATAADLRGFPDELDQELERLINTFRSKMKFLEKTRETFFASLSVLPATLGIVYIITTADPVGAGGVYTKFSGLFGLHDLWALVAIPATTGLDEAGRHELSKMLTPVVQTWWDKRKSDVQSVFEQKITGDILRNSRDIVEESSILISEIENLLQQCERQGGVS